MEIIHSLPCSSSVMSELKILFTGTMGAGKTTAIAAISDIAPVVTDVANTDTSVAKARTTVGLDFGLVSLADGNRMRLFGTPGQERFDFMWKILAQNAFGLIILIDNSRPDPVQDFRIYLDGFSDDLRMLPCTVGVGRTESHPQPSLEAYVDEMAQRGLVFPVLPVDVRRKQDVLLLLDTLIAQNESALDIVLPGNSTP